jgi:hypothetical protein
MNAIITRREVQQFTAERKLRDLKLARYADCEAETLFCEDDGLSLDYRKGAYNLMKISVTLGEKEAVFRSTTLYNGYASRLAYYTLEIHFVQNKPRLVAPSSNSAHSESVDGKHIQPGTWRFEAGRSMLYVRVPVEDQEIRISF